MKLHIYKDKQELSQSLAEWMCTVIEESLQQQEYFTLVLSGGSTPQSLYETLVKEPFKSWIPWQRVYIFWGDERVVPFADERNNARMAYDLLLNHVDIPANHVHIMRTDIEPNFSVDAYRKVLHDFFGNTAFSFDLVLLGMGDDGHTLSLFPESPLLSEKDRWVSSVYLPQQEMYRITLMPAIVNKASKIAFMAEGSKKAAMLQTVLQGPHEPALYPAQLIKPDQGELHWFVDEKAAADLHGF